MTTTFKLNHEAIVRLPEWSEMFINDKKIFIKGNGIRTLKEFASIQECLDRISDIFDADNCGLTHYDFTQEAGYWKPQPAVASNNVEYSKNNIRH